MRFPRAVLFDLDGTLLDSAPDMLATVNAMLEERGRAPIALAQLRPVVSKGARAMLAVAFAERDAVERDALVPEFLRRYEGLIGTQSQLFDGVDELLLRLERAGCIWGVVTNKPEYLARLILTQLGWEQRCAVLIGGDTLAERKPHPLPLLTAAERIGVAPAHCVYVGDDERDILAARGGDAVGGGVVGLSPARRRAVALAGRRSRRAAADTVGCRGVAADLIFFRFLDPP